MKKMVVFVGPVHSGKTTRALELARRIVRMGLDLVAVRPSSAIRDHEVSGRVTTKNGQSWPVVELESPAQLIDAADGADVIWVDEPMLFEGRQAQEDLVKAVRKIRKTSRVIVSGLGMTSELRRFGNAMPYLLATADEIVQCYSDCDDCLRESAATRSFYRPGPKKDKVVVGGVETYLALCPECWCKRHEEQLCG